MMVIDLIKETFKLFFIIFGLANLLRLIIGLNENEEGATKNNGIILSLLLGYPITYFLGLFNNLEIILNLHNVFDHIINIIIYLITFILATMLWSVIDNLVQIRTIRNIFFRDEEGNDFSLNNPVKNNQFYYYRIYKNGGNHYLQGDQYTKKLLKKLIEKEFKLYMVDDCYLTIDNNLNINFYNSIEKLKESIYDKDCFLTKISEHEISDMKKNFIKYHEKHIELDGLIKKEKYIEAAKTYKDINDDINYEKEIGPIFEGLKELYNKGLYKESLTGLYYIKNNNKVKEFLEESLFNIKKTYKLNQLNFMRLIVCDEKSRNKEIITRGENIGLGLKANGKVILVDDKNHFFSDYKDWRKKTVFSSYKDWQKITGISAGGIHIIGLREDGTVVSEGNYENGQHEVEEWEDIVSVSAGENHILGLKEDGTVVATGDNEYGQCDLEEWRDIIQISAGENYTLGLKGDGTVVATGDNEYGQCDLEEWRDIIQISAGKNHTIGLKNDGKVIGKGSYEYGQHEVEEWKDIVSISAGGNHIVGLKGDGTVVATGDNEYGQCDLEEWRDIIQISAGENEVIGLKSNGEYITINSFYGNYKLEGINFWDV